MADPIHPDAEAPDEGAGAPVEEAPEATSSTSTTALAPMRPETPPGAAAPEPSPAAAAQPPPAPKRAFEDWARKKHTCAIDAATGKATGVVAGKRVGRKATSNAAIVNATRSYNGIPIGRLMTEADYDAAVASTRAIVIK